MKHSLSWTYFSRFNLAGEKCVWLGPCRDFWEPVGWGPASETWRGWSRLSRSAPAGGKDRRGQTSLGQGQLQCTAWWDSSSPEGLCPLPISTAGLLVFLHPLPLSNELPTGQWSHSFGVFLISLQRKVNNSKENKLDVFVKQQHFFNKE